MDRNRGMFIVAAAVAAILAWSWSAEAAFITIFDPSGQSDFSLTYDDQQTGPMGLPQISNNTVFFVPNDFFAESENGLGQGSLNDSFAFRLDVLAGHDFTLDQFDLKERGDYLLDGPGSSVTAQGQLQVFDAFDPTAFFTDFLETGPLNIQDNQLHNWSGTASVGSADGWEGSLSAWITIENLLTAETSVLNEYAFIEKKFTGGAVQLTVTQVPIPPALWVFGAGLLTLVGARKR